MAIKINKFGDLQKVTPNQGDYFNVDMLERIVGGWPEPSKIGPIWLIKNEDVEKSFENYNQVASMFFQVPIYGDVITVSALELPPEWDLVNEEDTKYSVKEIDEGFLKSLADLAFTRDNVFDNNGDTIDDPFLGFTYPNVNDLFQHKQKNEYFYNPHKERHPETSVENYEDFLRDAFHFIVDSSKTDFDEFIIYEDDANIVKVNKREDQIKTIDQVLQMLIEDEDYEKCAVLKGIIDKSFSESSL